MPIDPATSLSSSFLKNCTVSKLHQHFRNDQLLRFNFFSVNVTTVDKTLSFIVDKTEKIKFYLKFEIDIKYACF